MTVTIYELRKRFGELAARVAFTGEPLDVSFHGAPHIRLVSARRGEGIETATAGPVDRILAGRETGRVERAVNLPGTKGT